MPIDAMLAPILETVLDAVVVMRRDGTIQGWNSIAERIFGWTASEAIGRNLGDLIVPEGLREVHRAGLARFNATGEARVLDHRLELSALRHDGTEFPVELAITLVKRDGSEAFVGFIRDISERRRLEEERARQVLRSRIMLDLALLAEQSPDLDHALVAALDAICSLSGWQLGHAFLVSDDSEDRLISAAWSTGAAERAPEFVALTERTDFRAGVGLPGRVLESLSPQWVIEASRDENFPRKGLGMEGGFGFPLFGDGRCFAIFEFFSESSAIPDPDVLETAQAIGTQVGRVFERRETADRQELLVGELKHRAKNILTMVQAIAHQSFAGNGELKMALQLFGDRIASVAAAYDSVADGGRQAADLALLIDRTLKGCGTTEHRVELSGPPILIGSTAAVAVSLAIHELCTNATKHGALSNDAGRVSIVWADRGDGRFDLTWSEHGGPPVETPTREGFGSRILNHSVERQTGGRVSLHYDPDGLRFELVGASALRAPADD